VKRINLLGMYHRKALVPAQTRAALVAAGFALGSVALGSAPAAGARELVPVPAPAGTGAPVGAGAPDPVAVTAAAAVAGAVGFGGVVGVTTAAINFLLKVV
jgi:hypothetical protein